jgi:hypothetical protein
MNLLVYGMLCCGSGVGFGVLLVFRIVFSLFVQRCLLMESVPGCVAASSAGNIAGSVVVVYEVIAGSFGPVYAAMAICRLVAYGP